MVLRPSFKSSRKREWIFASSLTKLSWYGIRMRFSHFMFSEIVFEPACKSCLKSQSKKLLQKHQNNPFHILFQVKPLTKFDLTLQVVAFFCD